MSRLRFGFVFPFRLIGPLAILQNFTQRAAQAKFFPSGLGLLFDHANRRPARRFKRKSKPSDSEKRLRP
jgi:hypothetical protein